MKSVKMACVHPAVLQLFQKLVEWMLGSGSEGGAAGEAGVAGEERRDTQMVSSGGAAELAELVTPRVVVWSGEKGGL